MTLGYFGLVLHAHIPYCKKSGVWPAGEEWLTEAVLESYVPFLNVLRELKEEDTKFAITVNITPILADQLADEYMKQRTSEYVESKIRTCKEDVERFKNNPERLKIAEFYLEKFENVRQTYYHNFYADILGTFKWLQDEGMVEVITSAATHGFLPLLENDSGIFSQIQTGVDTYKKYFKRDPKGFWLPECAYRPKEVKNGTVRETLDYWLNNSGLKYFFVDTHGIVDAELIKKKNDIGLETLFGYSLESGVSVFGRNENTSRQVWDATIGYPGDPTYREFHRKDHESGLNYWMITGKDVPQDKKALYNPDYASATVESQANHFVALLDQELALFKEIFYHKGIIVSPYDFELYGHWWMEGIDWLKFVFKNIAESDNIEMITYSDYIEQYKDLFSIINMKQSSWGEGGQFQVWKNPEHIWIWPYINSSIKELENVLEANPNPDNFGLRILKQMARELVLMEGSDWPFLLYTEQAKEYANQRFHNHHQRFSKLLWAAKDLSDKSRLNDNDFEEIESIDTCFQDINLDYFKRK